MGALVGGISSKSVAKKLDRLGTKNAWARYVRRRWPANTLAHIQDEWDLTEGQARGVLHAQASQPTIDDILYHPRGGFRLGLVILELLMEMRLEQFISKQAEEARHEAARHDAEARRLEALRARVAEPHFLDGRRD